MNVVGAAAGTAGPAARGAAVRSAVHWPDAPGLVLNPDPAGRLSPWPRFRDLLAQTKAEIREVDPAEADERRKVPGTVVLDVREPDEYEQGAIPGAVHIPRGTSRATSRAGSPTTTPRSSSTAPAASARRSRPRRWPSSATPTSSRWPAASTAGRTRAASGPRRVSLTADQRNRYQRHLLLPEVGVEGQQKLLDRQGAAARRRRPRLARRALPGRRRRRHDRHHRHGRGRRVQPPAPDPPQHGPHRRPQGRLGQEDPHAAQPRRRRRHLRRAPRRRQRDGHPAGLRRHRRRHRQLPHPLPRQRRRR